MLVVMLVWLWYSLLGVDSQLLPGLLGTHRDLSAHTDLASTGWWEETALEFLNLISNFYCSAMLSLLGGRKTSSPSCPFICLFTLISSGLY